nr:ABC transporter ATP-binding protein [Liquorilactobacillus satsumensis]
MTKQGGEIAIEFTHVQKKFSGKAVIKDLNLAVPANQIFVLVGPSGSGKTTILKMINALIQPNGGEITINGKKITEYRVQDLRWQMGYVLQQIALFPNMTVAQNIAVIPEMKKMPKKKIKERIETLLAQVDLPAAKYAERYPRELSGGEAQRVGIVRALAADPPLILMDEPFSALDPLSRTQLQKLVLRLQAQLHKTVVFVTHDMNEALKMGGMQLLLFIMERFNRWALREKFNCILQLSTLLAFLQILKKEIF